MKMIIVDNLVVKNGRNFEFSFSLLQFESHIEKYMPAFQVEREINWISSKNSTVKSRKWMIIPVFSLWWLFLDLHLQGKSIKDFREYLFYYQYYCEEISNVSFSLSVGGPKFFIESVLFCLPLISADIFLVASFK